MVQSAAPIDGPKRRPKPVRICRLYVTKPSEPLVHTQALLAFIQEECPNFVGGYVPRLDLERFYRHDLCNLKGWTPRHWTAIARQLGKITQKKVARERGIGLQLTESHASERTRLPAEHAASGNPSVTLSA